MSTTTDRRDDSPREIERELEAERGRLRETGRALQGRLSVGTLVDEMLARTRDRGPDYAVGFGRTIRDNPIPVALIGISIAWLMAGGQRASEERFRHDRGNGRMTGFEDGLDDVEDDDLESRPTPFAATPEPVGEPTAADEPLRNPPPAAGPADPVRPTPRPAGDIGGASPPASPSPLTGDTGPARPDPLTPGSEDDEPLRLRTETGRPGSNGAATKGEGTQSSGLRASTPPPAGRPAGTDEPNRPWQTDDKDKS